MYKTKYFKIHELVPPNVYKERGEKAYQLMDDRILRVIDQLRIRYGSATVNNYQWGGERMWSGLRTPDWKYFNPYSQHTFGRAVDMIFKDVTAEEIRQDILSGKNNNIFTGITAIETNVSWLHIDCRNVKPIYTFNP